MSLIRMLRLGSPSDRELAHELNQQILERIRMTRPLARFSPDDAQARVRDGAGAHHARKLLALAQTMTTAATEADAQLRAVASDKRLTQAGKLDASTKIRRGIARAAFDALRGPAFREARADFAAIRKQFLPKRSENPVDAVVGTRLLDQLRAMKFADLRDALEDPAAVAAIASYATPFDRVALDRELGQPGTLDRVIGELISRDNPEAFELLHQAERDLDHAHQQIAHTFARARHGESLRPDSIATGAQNDEYMAWRKRYHDASWDPDRDLITQTTAAELAADD